MKKASQIYLAAKQEIAAIDSSRPTCEIEKNLIWERACSKFMGDDDSVNTITQQLEKIQSYDKHDWLFLTGDFLMDEDVSLSDRFAMLDILKEKQEITAEDLIDLGLYTEGNRYHPFFLGLLKEDVAGNYAALLELSYRLTRTDTTLWEMSLQEQQMRSQQQFALLYYLGLQSGLTSVQAYNAAGSAIRMEGATNATPGYESVPSDYLPFNYNGTQYSWYNSDGSINYPPDNGAVPGSEVTVTLMPGQILGRYGTPTDKSHFLTVAGAESSTLALPPNTDPSKYYTYEVIKPIPNTVQSTIRDWGGSSGGGIQYDVPQPIRWLLYNGYLKVR